MSVEKLIVIGCDDTMDLSMVMGNLKDTASFCYNIISATMASGLIGILKSLKPDLVILSFRNNQHILSDLNTFVKKPEVPILCITRKFDGILDWKGDNIVFTCQQEHINTTAYLSSRVNSIFLLNTGPAVVMPALHTFTAAAKAAESDQNRNLSRYVMELDQKVDVLLKIKERIGELYPRVDDRTRTELTAIVNSIKLSHNDHKLWDDFKLYFEQTNPDFLLLLARKYPSLTAVDLKYCCYLKMNMSNDDIRNLLGINQESVRTHKYRLKKKMALGRDQNLSGYLRSVDQHQLQSI